MKLSLGHFSIHQNPQNAQGGKKNFFQTFFGFHTPEIIHRMHSNVHAKFNTDI